MRDWEVGQLDRAGAADGGRGKCGVIVGQLVEGRPGEVIVGFVADRARGDRAGVSPGGFQRGKAGVRGHAGADQGHEQRRS